MARRWHSAQSAVDSKKNFPPREAYVTKPLAVFRRRDFTPPSGRFRRLQNPRLQLPSSSFPHATSSTSPPPPSARTHSRTHARFYCSVVQHNHTHTQDEPSRHTLHSARFHSPRSCGHPQRKLHLHDRGQQLDADLEGPRHQ